MEKAEVYWPALRKQGWKRETSWGQLLQGDGMKMERTGRIQEDLEVELAEPTDGQFVGTEWELPH